MITCEIDVRLTGKIGVTLDDRSIHQIIAILRKTVKSWKAPAVTLVSRNKGNPFKVLISTILSLRTKDAVTIEASRKLFRVADNPYSMVSLTEKRIEELIYPVGFYRRKAKNIREICRILIDNYSGNVPNTIDELLKFPGVGRKTANLVVTLGYNKPGICVDTHVHRISNRLGYVKTKNPKETEFALRAKLPKDYWIEYNDLLVTLGQNICRPISPFCSRCPIERYCDKVGVKKSR